jgi:hypothetical protein
MSEETKSENLFTPIKSPQKNDVPLLEIVKKE